MRLRILLSVFFLVSLGAAAQQRRVSVVKDDVPSTGVAKQYADSLAWLKDSIFSVKNTKKQSKIRGRGSSRLFLPLTFYRDVAGNMFSLGKPESSYDTELMRLYLTRPDLVWTTNDAVQAQQTKLNEIEQPIVHDVHLVEKVNDKPVEPATVPVEVMVVRPNFWTYSGSYSLQFLQNYVSDNWYKGGESNYAALAAVVMDANYNNKQKVKWSNRLELKYGMQSTRSDSLHSVKSTDDLIRLTSKFGLQATKKWYYTVQFIGYTQFGKSYRSNDPTVYSAFLSPANINISLGMDYSADWLGHRLKGTFHIAPLAYNLKYTRMLELSERLGIGAGHHFLHDFGSECTIDLEWKLLEMLTWRTRLYGYTTYRRSEVEWENTFSFQFNRYISTQLFIYPRFDDGVARDSRHAYFQLKEFASVGFQFSF